MINWRSVDPNKLKLQFRRDVELLLAQSPFSWTVTHGFRTIEEQRVLYERWKNRVPGAGKAAPPGKSKHNFREAVDVALDGDPAKAGLQPDWDTSHAGWQWLFEAVWKHPRLHSGRSFGDADHIEAWKKPSP